MEPADAKRGGGRRQLLPFRVALPRLPLPGIPGLRLARPGGGGGGAHAARAGAAASAAALAAAPAAATPASAAAAKPAKPATKPASDVLAGALARALSQGTIHPLDTLKVRLQARGAAAGGAGAPAARAPAAPSPAAGAAAPAVRGLSKFGQLVPPPAAGADLRAMGAGLASLYRGVLGAASGAGIAIGAYFACYGAAHNAVSANTSLSPGAVAFVSGGIAAAGSSVVKVPLAVCIRSVQAGVYPNVFAAARSITAQAGPGGLFTGFFPTLLEDVPDMAVKFAAYESLRQLHRRLNDGRAASPQEDFAMGAFAGAAAAASTTPLDVIKTRMMCAAASRPTMAGAAREILATSGPRGFLAGIGARALSNGINSAVFFCFFEAIRSGMQAQAHMDAARAAAAWAGRARERAAAVPRLLGSWRAAAGGLVLYDGAGAGSGRHWATAGRGALACAEDDGGDDGRAGMSPPLSLSLLARASPLRLDDSQFVMAVQALKGVEESTNISLEEEP